MKNEFKKFLEFNGKTIYFIARDGQYWIAIKPICRALNVDFIRQFKNLKSDAILKAALSVQTMQAPDGQLRKYLCLPEFFIYGWMFQIQSQSEELLKYKWECYRIIFEHFHGTITGRKELIKQKAQNSIQIESLRNIVFASDNAQSLAKLEKNQKAIEKSMRQLDNEQLEEELDLFRQNIEGNPNETN
jgi:hypothetical protein